MEFVKFKNEAAFTEEVDKIYIFKECLYKFNNNKLEIVNLNNETFYSLQLKDTFQIYKHQNLFQIIQENQVFMFFTQNDILYLCSHNIDNIKMIMNFQSTFFLLLNNNTLCSFKDQNKVICRGVSEIKIKENSLFIFNEKQIKVINNIDELFRLDELDGIKISNTLIDFFPIKDQEFLIINEDNIQIVDKNRIRKQFNIKLKKWEYFMVQYQSFIIVSDNSSEKIFAIDLYEHKIHENIQDFMFGDVQNILDNKLTKIKFIDIYESTLAFTFNGNFRIFSDTLSMKSLYIHEKLEIKEVDIVECSHLLKKVALNSSISSSGNLIDSLEQYNPEKSPINFKTIKPVENKIENESEKIRSSQKFTESWSTMPQIEPFSPQNKTNNFDFGNLNELDKLQNTNISNNQNLSVLDIENEQTTKNENPELYDPSNDQQQTISSSNKEFISTSNTAVNNQNNRCISIDETNEVDNNNFKNDFNDNIAEQQLSSSPIINFDNLDSEDIEENIDREGNQFEENQAIENFDKKVNETINKNDRLMSFKDNTFEKDEFVSKNIPHSVLNISNKHTDLLTNGEDTFNEEQYVLEDQEDKLNTFKNNKEKNFCLNNPTKDLEIESRYNTKAKHESSLAFSNDYTINRNLENDSNDKILKDSSLSQYSEKRNNKPDENKNGISFACFSDVYKGSNQENEKEILDTQENQGTPSGSESAFNNLNQKNNIFGNFKGTEMVFNSKQMHKSKNSTNFIQIDKNSQYTKEKPNETSLLKNQFDMFDFPAPPPLNFFSNPKVSVDINKNKFENNQKKENQQTSISNKKDKFENKNEFVTKFYGLSDDIEYETDRLIENFMNLEDFSTKDSSIFKYVDYKSEVHEYLSDLHDLYILSKTKNLEESFNQKLNRLKDAIDSTEIFNYDENIDFFDNFIQRTRNKTVTPSYNFKKPLKYESHSAISDVEGKDNVASIFKKIQNKYEVHEKIKEMYVEKDNLDQKKEKEVYIAESVPSNNNGLFKSHTNVVCDNREDKNQTQTNIFNSGGLHQVPESKPPTHTLPQNPYSSVNFHQPETCFLGSSLDRNSIFINSKHTNNNDQGNPHTDTNNDNSKPSNSSAMSKFAARFNQFK